MSTDGTDDSVDTDGTDDEALERDPDTGRPVDPVAAGDTAGVETTELAANGLTFECLVQRPAADADTGDLAVCMHGFPDDAGSMVPVMDALAGAGYVAVAPYMRGYAPTDSAPDGDYSGSALGRDAVELLDAASEAFDRDEDGQRALVGHDWGAAAGYTAAAMAPDAIDRLVTMAVPPAFNALLREHPRQVFRSWYMWLFQLPGLPERALQWRDFEFVEFLWGLWSPGWDYSRSRIQSVKATFARGDTVENALAYYRQIIGGSLRQLVSEGPGSLDGDLSVPALVVAGERDGCIAPGLFDEVDRAFDAPCRVVRVSDAGHFMHQERPAVVGDEIVAFLTDG